MTIPDDPLVLFIEFALSLVVFSLVMNLLSDLIADWWSRPPSLSSPRTPEGRKSRPGRLTYIYSEKITDLWIRNRRDAKVLVTYLEVTLRWLADDRTTAQGDAPSPGELIQEEVNEEGLGLSDHVALLVWSLPSAAADRFSKRAGQLAGIAIGTGTLISVPLYLTSHPLINSSVESGSTATGAAISYLTLAIGMARWAAAASHCPSLTPTRELRQALTFIGMGVPGALLTLVYVHPADLILMGGMLVSWLGCMLLIVQEFRWAPESVRRVGLTTIAIGTAFITAGDLYWFYFSLRTGTWLWTASLALIVAGTAFATISAGLATQLLPGGPDDGSTTAA